MGPDILNAVRRPLSISNPPPPDPVIRSRRFPLSRDGARGQCAARNRRRSCRHGRASSRRCPKPMTKLQRALVTAGMRLIEASFPIRHPGRAVGRCAPAHAPAPPASALHIPRVPHRFAWPRTCRWLAIVSRGSIAPAANPQRLRAPPPMSAMGAARPATPTRPAAAAPAAPACAAVAAPATQHPRVLNRGETARQQGCPEIDRLNAAMRKKSHRAAASRALSGHANEAHSPAAQRFRDAVHRATPC